MKVDSHLGLLPSHGLWWRTWDTQGSPQAERSPSSPKPLREILLQRLRRDVVAIHATLSTSSSRAQSQPRAEDLKRAEKALGLKQPTWLWALKCLSDVSYFRGCITGCNVSVSSCRRLPPAIIHVSESFRKQAPTQEVWFSSAWVKIN